VVKAPLMLELGVLPDVAAATSASMIAFTSLAACLVYADFGLIPVDYGLVMLVLGMLVRLGLGVVAGRFGGCGLCYVGGLACFAESMHVWHQLTPG